nr:M42 family metallopeptidase [Tissierella sp.]
MKSKAILEKLEELLLISSPTGNTDKAVAFLEEEFKKLDLEINKNNKGNIFVTVPGRDTSKEVTVSAHVDTLGAMVKEIKADGRLKLTQLGGYSYNSIEGEYVEIETMEGKIFTGTVMTTKASSHVHGKDLETVERTIENMEVRIDEKVSSKDEVLELGINVGDFISFDPRTQVLDNGFIKSRHLDDKAGVISILFMLKEILQKDLELNYTTNFFISHYEEVGHGSSASITPKTFEFLAIDMAAPGLGQTSDEFSVTICAKDSTGPYDLEMRKRLTKLSKENGINYKVDIYPFYGSDASAALRAGYDMKAALIGPGVDASHSFERTHVEAIEATINLGLLYLTK